MNDNLSSHKATDYDVEIQKTIPNYSLMHSEILTLVEAVKPHVKKWIDTGCGTGTLIENALVKFPECSFYLSDPSESMLSICKERFSNAQVEIIGQYSTAEIITNIQAEVVTAILCHHYLIPEERKKATRHCFKLLKKGGLYITFENIKPDSKEGIEIGLKRWKHYQMKQGKDEKEVNEHISRFDKNYFPIKMNEHIELMKNAGFKTVELFWLSNMQAGLYGIK